MSNLFKGERLYTEAETLAAIKRALEGAAKKADSKLKNMRRYVEAQAVSDAIRALDPAQFIEEPKR
jgi:predicted RNA binding protein with dsRBD fold (UPF0201 family)